MLHRILPSVPCLLAALFLQFALSPAQALDPGLPPSGNFDLSNWYLGLPIDDQGGTSGDSASISTVELLGGYTNALYFYTDTDGSMVFWAPVDGATTSGSSFPRSELRELISPPSTLVNWSGYGTHILDAQCKVTEVPSTKKVIIGQIHSKTGNARPLVKLLYDDGQIRALVKESPNADPDINFNFANVGLNNPINYKIQMVDGLITMTVNGSSQQMDAFASDPDWANQEFYFKAGSYCQDNGGSSSEGARVAFYSLTTSHGTVTNPPPGVTVTNLIVDDSFADGNRANTGPLQADWWSSSSTSGNSIEASVGALGLISGTSGRGIHGTFAPQTLGVGESLTATYTFTTPTTVGVNKSTSFKVAMMDFNNAGLAADLSSSSSSANPLYVGQPGYMSDFDVNTGAAADISIREHDQSSTLGRFLGTTTEWINSDSSADAGYGFAANTEYVGVFSITRTGADSVAVFSSMSQGGVLMDSYLNSYNSGIANHFGMLGFWANSDTFGSSTTEGNPDNGITFSNIKVEVVTLSTEAPTLGIALSGNDIVVSWPTNGTAGFDLESTPSMIAPSWSPAGSPTIVGDQSQVTTPATGGPTFYRLKKP